VPANPPPPPPIIVPFWERLPQISRYPLRVSPMTTLLVYGILAVLLSYLMFGFFLRLLVMIGFYKYAFECLRASANGEEEAPEFGMKLDDRVGLDQLKLQVICLLLLVLAFWAGGYWLMLMMLGVVSLAQPGANMSLAIDQNLWHAINPATWLAIMARIPGPYIAVTSLIFVFSASQETATGWFSSFLPGFLAEIVVQCGVFYTMLSTFHLMGWLIWQYQEDLGYEPEIKLVLKNVRDDPDQALIDESERLARDGRIEEARDFLGDAIRRSGATPAVHQRFRKLLEAMGDAAGLENHGRQFISVLLAQDQEQPALELLKECQAANPRFQPAQPEESSRMARKAAALGMNEVALKLLAGFHQQWPKNKEVPANLLFAAKLLSGKLRQDDKARAVLGMLKTRFPDHPLAAEADQFLATLAPAGSPLRV
jgi:hypothetical protein